ncbi:hypothetical protein D3C72_2399000 [compost metagenome]
MNAKKKNIAKEPTVIYEATSKAGITSEELNPILIQLIEKSKKEYEQGLDLSHEEAKQKIKLKFPL